ncbi:MAG: hypothetical protein ACO3GK_03420, partial [Bacteroidia bacterium]
MIKKLPQILHEKSRQRGLRTAAIVADLLHISEDSAYRRIKRPESFKADELVLLAREFRINLNSLVDHSNDWLQGNYIGFDQENPSADTFYELLKQRLDRTLRLNAPKVLYGAKEIPFFYYMWFPHLSAFKEFIWNRDFLHRSDLSGTLFHAEAHLQPRHIALAERYLKIPSEEVWSYETLFSTLYQIQHYRECGLFAEEQDYRNVMGEFDALVELIFEQAEKGYKINPYLPKLKGASYKLYFNALTNVDNSLVFDSEKDQVAVVCSSLSGVITSDCEPWVA